MTAHERDDDLIHFASEEEAEERPERSVTPWRILIVDDDEDVHRASRFALGGLHILGRPLEFLEARSARAAREILEDERDIACILLDVVMETERAGLDLVEFVRRKLGNSSVQIVLRTGQPGYAPELSVIRDYDINDYRSKSEMTHTRLVTTLTAALRTYDQITTIEHSQRGLESLVRGAAELVNKHDLKGFCRSVLTQIELLLDQPGEAMLCRRTREDDKPWEVLAGSGEFETMTGTRMNSFDLPDLVQALHRVEHSEDELLAIDGAILVPVRTASDELLVLHVLTGVVPGPVQRRLLRLLAVNIAFGYENARMFEHVEQLAYFDELTGSPNRAALLDLTEALIGKEDPFALLVVDIDHFQTINDGLGREAGDRVLQKFLHHLGTAVGPGATVGRLSGDSFAAIVPKADFDQLESEYDQFCRGLARGIEVYDYDIPLTVTGGLVQFPEHGGGADELFHNAGIALKHGKRSARSTLCHFSRDYERQLQRRLKVARDLGAGILEGQLLVHYQPRISLANNQVTGVEALVRWQRGDRLVRPHDFIEAAEESGLIVEVGRHVLTEACRQQQAWREKHGIDLAISVNVSMRQLRDADFLAVVDETLERTGIDPACIEFEVTESTMIEDAGIVQTLLTELRRRGTRIAVDDFGTGYSSLSYLQKLPLDRVKVDQSFVAGVDKRKEDRVIVSMIINMSHLLDFQVVAEGVETLEQRDALKALGCDECQGYYFSPPLPGDEIADFVKNFNHRSD